MCLSRLLLSDPRFVSQRTENCVSGHPRPHVPPRHPLPGHHQRLQQRSLQRPVVGVQQAKRHRQVHDDVHLHDLQRNLRIRPHPLHLHSEVGRTQLQY